MQTESQQIDIDDAEAIEARLRALAEPRGRPAPDVHAELLRLLCRLARSEIGLCYVFVASSDGTAAVDFLVEGPEELRAQAPSRSENALLEELVTDDQGRTLEYADAPALGTSFEVTDATLYPTLGTYRRFLGPNRIHTILGAVSSADGHARGWIGAYRWREEPSFARRDVARVKRHEGAILRAFNAGLDHDPFRLPLHGVIAIFDAAGRLLQRSADVPDWFPTSAEIVGARSNAKPDAVTVHATDATLAARSENPLLSELRAVVRDFARGGDSYAQCTLARNQLDLTRLVAATAPDGVSDAKRNSEDGRAVTVQVRLSPLEYYPLPAGMELTPAQREVARIAVRGATVNEIATHLNRSPETVRSHLRAIYERLGVASRVELAAALDGGPLARSR
jgi:DNA-binding NarL/FixJ family response regulator